MEVHYHFRWSSISLLATVTNDIVQRRKWSLKLLFLTLALHGDPYCKFMYASKSWFEGYNNRWDTLFKIFSSVVLVSRASPSYAERLTLSRSFCVEGAENKTTLSPGYACVFNVTRRIVDCTCLMVLLDILTSEKIIVVFSDIHKLTLWITTKYIWVLYRLSSFDRPQCSRVPPLQNFCCRHN